MIVYRLEKDGFGPFTVGLSVGHRIKPSGFKKGDTPNNFVYGCLTEASLRDYFNTRLDGLLAANYRIKKYNVPRRVVRQIDSVSEIAFPIYYLNNGLKDYKDLHARVLKRQQALERLKPFSDSIDI